MKEQHISVCSTTLFIGKVPKTTSEEELKEELEKYGKVDSINMIPPRGCAFVCMMRRKDANKACDRLKGYKFLGSELRVAWAPGIGVKESEFKDRWDVEQGVTYIPWGQMPDDLNRLKDGGIIDEDSLPENLKGKNIGGEKPEITEEMKQVPGQVPNSIPQPMPGQPISAPGPFPPGMPPGMMPHGGMMPPMGMPHMMVPGSMPPGQIPGQLPPQMAGQLPPGVQQQMAMASGMPPPMPGQPPPGMIPLPGGGVGLRQVGPPPSSAPGLQLSQNIQNIMASTAAGTLASPQPLTVFRPGFQPQPGFPPPFQQFPGQPFRMQPPNFNQGPPIQMHQHPPGAQPAPIPNTMQPGLGHRPLLGGPGPRPMFNQNQESDNNGFQGNKWQSNRGPPDQIQQEEMVAGASETEEKGKKPEDVEDDEMDMDPEEKEQLMQFDLPMSFGSNKLNLKKPDQDPGDWGGGRGRGRGGFDRGHGGRGGMGGPRGPRPLMDFDSIMPGRGGRGGFGSPRGFGPRGPRFDNRMPFNRNFRGGPGGPPNFRGPPGNNWRPPFDGPPDMRGEEEGNHPENEKEPDEPQEIDENALPTEFGSRRRARGGYDNRDKGNFGGRNWGNRNRDDNEEEWEGDQAEEVDENALPMEFGSSRRGRGRDNFGGGNKDEEGFGGDQQDAENEEGLDENALPTEFGSRKKFDRGGGRGRDNFGGRDRRSGEYDRRDRRDDRRDDDRRGRDRNPDRRDRDRDRDRDKGRERGDRDRDRDHGKRDREGDRDRDHSSRKSRWSDAPEAAEVPATDNTGGDSNEMTLETPPVVDSTEGQSNGHEISENIEPNLTNGNESSDPVEKTVEPQTKDADKVLEEGEIE